MSFYDRTVDWTSSIAIRLSAVTFDDAMQWIRFRASNAIFTTKRIVAMLTGAPLPPLPSPEPPTRSDENSEKATKRESLGLLGGLFPNLRRKQHITREEEEDFHQWTTGEVHADFVRDKNGNFVYRYLVIDLPNSQVRHPRRVFVEKMPGVQEGESVLHWG